MFFAVESLSANLFKFKFRMKESMMNSKLNENYLFMHHNSYTISTL